MDDVYGKVDVFPEYFQSSSKPTEPSSQTQKSSCSSVSRSPSHLWSLRRVMGAATILKLFSLPRLPWESDSSDEKIQLTRAEVESLRTEIQDVEDREMQLKAQLQQVDEILRSARFCGYLYIRTRWAQLPGEPPILDDADVDDWLPRFILLQGPCIFYYLKSTDLSPQDSTLLSDVVEVGSLPSFKQEDGQTRYGFYISTRHGLRFECSSLSKVQIDSWLAALKNDCNLKS